MKKNAAKNGEQQKHTFHILGKEYNILSKLDDATFLRITALIKEQINALPSGVKHDEKMVIACLQLAYTLDTLSQKCARFLEDHSFQECKEE